MLVAGAIGVARFRVLPLNLRYLTGLIGFVLPLNAAGLVLMMQQRNKLAAGGGQRPELAGRLGELAPIPPSQLAKVLWQPGIVLALTFRTVALAFRTVVLAFRTVVLTFWRDMDCLRKSAQRLGVQARRLRTDRVRFGRGTLVFWAGTPELEAFVLLFRALVGV